MKLAEFASWVIRNAAWTGYDLDGGDVQDMAEKCGLISITKYSRDLHGDNEFGVQTGDDWYEFSPEMKSALGQQ